MIGSWHGLGISGLDESQGSNGKKTAKDEEDEKMNAAHYAEGTDFTKTTEKKLRRILNTDIWPQNTNKTSL